ncbi:hypothetical protein JJB98_29130 [Bradyrhizobium diazoefficiens]|nr:hypothetical protein [Bradyrhizobium diazoefficiens]QQO23682.1 hypothetical protein JJB98_29130 [Bradyrhizobium diazoefficiens]
MIDIAGVQQRCPRRQPELHRGVESLTPGSRIDIAIGLAPVHRLELVGRSRKDVADVVVAKCDGEIAADSGVSPWLKASASMGE